MKINLASESVKFQKSSETAWEYEKIDDGDINICVVAINGRHPASGFVCNTKCKEMIYILSGECIAATRQNEPVALHEGDVVLFDINEDYRLEGNFKAVVPCTPAWTPEQAKVSD